MSYCRICGAEGAKFYGAKRLTLCKGCAKDTPTKICREDFDRYYWGNEFQNVPDSIRREFYEDYLFSTDDVDSYIIATTKKESSR